MAGFNVRLNGSAVESLGWHRAISLLLLQEWDVLLPCRDSISVIEALLKVAVS